MPVDDAAPSIRPTAWLRVLTLVPLLAWISTACWHAFKPLPTGTHVAGPWVPVAPHDVRFIADVTAADGYGRPVMSQAIFDETLQIVRQARELIVLDQHLFSDDSKGAEGLRPLAAQLQDALIARRRALPGLNVLLITDPINALQGHTYQLSLLEAGGVHVVTADLGRLRDGSFMYSALWRLAIRWWADGSDESTGWWPDPTGTGGRSLSFGAWAQLLNFKADQRRVIIADDGHGGLVGIVGSSDPHQGSSQYSNAALQIAGPVLAPLLDSELAIARLSGWTGSLPLPSSQGADGVAPTRTRNAAQGMRAQVLTEGAIGTALLAQLGAAGPSDTIDIATLYLADRSVIIALLQAARRGVTVRIILDPGKDGFGQARSGLPNQPVASELVSASDGRIHVRWYRTHGEQFHTRLVMVHDPARQWLLVGSADLTRHALSDHHLEADVAVDMPASAPLASQTRQYFDTLWSNRAGAGIEYTADFAVYADPAQSHYWLYRVLEGAGWAPF